MPPRKTKASPIRKPDEKEKNMRQKYVISLNDSQERLKIKEYAIIDKNLRKVALHVLKKGSFSFLCEETYESDTILKAMSKGMDALVAILRTPKIFPIEPYASKIAEAVVSLYDSETGSLELYFDDIDLISA